MVTKALLGIVLTLAAMSLNYKVAEASAGVGEMAPVFFRSFRDAFHFFGLPLPFLGLVSFFVRLAAYGLVVLVVILLLKDRRSTAPTDQGERGNSNLSTRTAPETRRGNVGAVAREGVREEEEIERLRGRIACLEERLSRLESERPE